MSVFLAQFRRDLKLLLRSVSDIVNPLTFLFVAVTLFALALGAVEQALSAYAAGIVWVLVLLTNLLAMETLFRRDAENGALEQLLLLADVPFMAIAGKLAVQWLATGFVITLASPLLALVMQLPQDAFGRLALALLLGTPCVSMLGAIGAALTVGLRAGGALMGLLVLPLYIPVLIFGTTAVNGIMEAGDGLAQMYWLAALSVASMTLAPFAIVVALKISMED